MNDDNFLFTVIKGFEKYSINKKGIILSNNLYRNKKPKYLKLINDKDGYLTTTLFRNNKRKKLRVHRLVALTFLPNPENKPQVNHINGIKDDNRIQNLEWCTISENVIHSFDVLGRKGHWIGKRGKEMPHSRKVAQYDLNNNLIKIWDCAKDIQRELNYTASFITACCRKKKHYKTGYGFKWRYADAI